MNPFKLSPSMLTFFWDECPRCFYLQVVRGISRPPTAFPKVFTRIDSLMKGLFANQPASRISPALPPGKVAMQGKWVTSEPLQIPGIGASCYIKGAFDSVISFDDGSYCVMDFKTSQPSPAHLGFYGRQLHAYAYALEHPAPKALGLHPVKRLGLLYLDPVDIDHLPDQRRITYGGEVTWTEIPLEMERFMDFMSGVLTVLAQPEPPPPSEGCAFCAYREEARLHGL
jgi:hypothetical protein